MNTLRLLLVAVGIFVASHANASFITTNETDLDSIFSQSSFGFQPIDIRIGEATELYAPDLLDITSDAEVDDLFSMHVGLWNVVNFYFIDTISACGGTMSSGIVGCGETPGNDFVVESSFAAGSFGGELLAHELAHNLGLHHRTGDYLMNPQLNHNTTLTIEEVDIIRTSPLVQTNGQDFWININPVLIVNTIQDIDVPEPGTLGVFLFSLCFLFIRNKKEN